MPRLTSSLTKIAMALAFFTIVTIGSAGIAKADAFVITNSNFAGNGNFGTITTSLVNVNQIQVNVQLAAGYVLHGQAFGFNINGSNVGVTIGSITPNFTYVGDSGNMDGFGSFAYIIDGPTTANARTLNTNSLSFIVSRTGGFSSVNDIQFPNASGWIFAVQIAPIDPQANTGFAATNTRVTVPEPASMLLLGTGLLGAAAGIRRRRNKD
jgi:hypothetical protein